VFGLVSERNDRNECEEKRRKEGNHDNYLYTAAVWVWIANLSGFCVYLLNVLALRA
jgi:hypothetical protein